MVSLEAVIATDGDVSSPDTSKAAGSAPRSRPRHIARWREPQSGLPYYWAESQPGVFESSRGRQAQLKLKRAFDVVVAGLALLFLLPFFVLIGAAVKLTSPGPVLFSQSREGMHGRSFNALKFRTMRTELCDASGVAQTVAGDPRVTPTGRFLRRTSIDELPQLINVLRGEMSLVGPRPHVRGMRAGGMNYRELVPYYDRRLEMLPGITGWAQANGLRGSTDDAAAARARVDHDIAYIQNFSLLLDIKIILLTMRREFLGGSGH